jgi:hypothetical protein
MYAPDMAVVESPSPGSHQLPGVKVPGSQVMTLILATKHAVVKQVHQLEGALIQVAKSSQKFVILVGVASLVGVG